MWRCLCSAALLGALATGVALAASDIDEFKVKREAVFEFVQKPSVARQGDRVTITFETKGFCDATVALENENGKIVRHLGCGVLGPNAPEPFQKNSKKQVIVWDGKDEKGEYIDDKDGVSVRVSLGLRTQFERAFQWSPHRRVGGNTPSICPAPEGVYVFEGNGFDHLRLFDHQGNYVRTIYPFPADKVDSVQGVKRHVMPQDGKDWPLKWGMRQSTLLTSGFTGVWELKGVADAEAATRAMAVGNGRIFLPCLKLNRLGTDGSSGGMPFEGPETAVRAKDDIPAGDYWSERLRPRSAALSPDGKTLYLTGFSQYDVILGYMPRWRWGDCVTRMDPLGKDAPSLFVGALKPSDTTKPVKENGSADNTRLRMPTSVACDAQGRVYVADHGNDRIQVFDPDGTHVKTIPVPQPADVCVHQKTGDIYVFSWLFWGPYSKETRNAPAMMRHLGPLSDPREISSCPLPLLAYRGIQESYDPNYGTQYRAALDSWTDPPTIWLVPGTTFNQPRIQFNETCPLLVTEKDGKLVVKRNLAEGTEKVRPRPEPIPARPRLYVNPKTGKLYVGEGESDSAGVGFKSLIEVDPATGRQRVVQIPFDSEDLAFDMDGLAYLRTLTEIARYDPATWTEVPFDYGQERAEVTTGTMSGARSAAVVSALVGPEPERLWHQGGLWVSPKGHIVSAVYCSKTKVDRRTSKMVGVPGTAFTPVLFPGRLGRGIISVWDKHGRLITPDAIPGLGIFDGVAMDKNDDLYVMSAGTRVMDGERYFDYMTGTGIKFRFGRAKVLTTFGGAPVPLTPEAAPRRPPELADGGVGPAWAEGALWFYGGVSYNGNDHPVMGGCSCWNARFALDYFARSFWPEVEHYSVAVLDTNGNLILRVGRYGNVDDGKPLVAEGAPPNPRSLGGDEVGLFYPAYLATQTDRRLFIADPGNARIVSVRLDYHATERVALKDVEEPKP